MSMLVKYCKVLEQEINNFYNILRDKQNGGIF